MNIPFDEALLYDREPDNDVILDNLYEKYLNRGYAPDVAAFMRNISIEDMPQTWQNVWPWMNLTR